MADIAKLAGAPAAVAPRLPSPTSGPSAQKTAREFEATFIGQMTQLMLESAPTDSEFSGGHGEEMFRGVLAEKLGGEIAKRGGIGLAPIVLDQIIKLQGGNPDVR
jgi:Rod binding domain-containing protein